MIVNYFAQEFIKQFSPLIYIYIARFFNGKIFVCDKERYIKRKNANKRKKNL